VTPARAERSNAVAVVTRAGASDRQLEAARKRLRVPVVHAPMFALEPVDERALADAFDRSGPFECVIVTSPRAAEVALRALGTQRLRDTRCVTPGSGTADVLRTAVPRIAHPESGGTSEDVLALPWLAAERVAGRPVLILAADGGRTLIAETLAARGAEVRVLAPYRRVPLQPSQALLDALDAGRVPVTLVSSPATLRRLADALSGTRRAAWIGGAFVVSSARLAEQVRALGAGDVTLAEGAADPAMFEAFRRRIDAATPR
jgi:uroporphyrinogen-III synthase